MSFVSRLFYFRRKMNHVRFSVQLFSTNLLSFWLSTVILLNETNFLLLRIEKVRLQTLCAGKLEKGEILCLCSKELLLVLSA